jgi:hypothetical protein
MPQQATRGSECRQAHPGLRRESKPIARDLSHGGILGGDLLNFSVERLSIPDVLLVRPRRFGDARGWFMFDAGTHA